MQFLTSLDLGSRVGVVVKGKREGTLGAILLLIHFGLAALQLAATLWLICAITSRPGASSGSEQSEQISQIQSSLEGLTALKELVLSTRSNPGQIIAPSEPTPKAATECAGNVTHLYGLKGRLVPKGFKPFEALLKASQSTKNWHSMGHMYGEYLDPLRLQQRPVNMMEIGLQFGASLNLWFSAFPKGKVYGLEYNKLQLKQAAGDKTKARATIFRGDQTNVTLLGEIKDVVRKEVGLLDFIVDDGGHSMEQQIVSFTHLMPLVKPGGMYFIEDLQTSYWSTCHHHWNKEKYCYGGGPVGKKNTTIDVIKSFIDVLNADFMEDHPNRDKLGSGIYSVNPSDKLIGSVQCWRNMCAFRRKFQGSAF